MLSNCSEHNSKKCIKLIGQGEIMLLQQSFSAINPFLCLLGRLVIVASNERTSSEPFFFFF